MSVFKVLQRSSPVTSRFYLLVDAGQYLPRNETSKIVNFGFENKFPVGLENKLPVGPVYFVVLLWLNG